MAEGGTESECGRLQTGHGGNGLTKDAEGAEWRELNPEGKKKVLRDIIRWQRIGCIVVKLSESLGIPLKAALDLFYASRTCRRFHDESTGLYLFSDLYIVDEVIREYRYGR